ncbi:hypothetical protein P4646_24465 [Peribacillus simplex]|uniref:hypothetical protein n=1 Tax=Peribacillus simplex TaxID=1478 RepID=UPI002E1EA93A|nr:hypothetical protein [Peribacillus simplex]MED4092800.1 hypothetical protein [Peribacillus simplex]
MTEMSIHDSGYHLFVQSAEIIPLYVNQAVFLRKNQPPISFTGNLTPFSGKKGFI